MSQFAPRTSRPLRHLALSLVILTALAACGGGGSSGSSTSPGTPASGNAVLSWTAPTTNTNGTALTDLSGYTILYGSNPSTLNQSIEISSAAAVSYTVSGLAAGTWYFSVVANSNDGAQSAPTAPVSVTIT